jgi:hypothetical protein
VISASWVIRASQARWTADSKAMGSLADAFAFASGSEPDLLKSEEGGLSDADWREDMCGGLEGTSFQAGAVVSALRS